MNITLEELTKAYELWISQRKETPELFYNEEEFKEISDKNYAKACAEYLMELLEEVKDSL